MEVILKLLPLYLVCFVTNYNDFAVIDLSVISSQGGLQTGDCFINITKGSALGWNHRIYGDMKHKDLVSYKFIEVKLPLEEDCKASVSSVNGFLVSKETMVLRQ